MKTNRICFLWYAREDKEHARRLYRQLTAGDINVWFDEESFYAHDNLMQSVKKAILSSRYCLVLLSSQSAKNVFFQQKMVNIIKILQQHIDHQLILIPVRIEDCMPSHERLQKLKWIDLFPDWVSGVSKIIQWILNRPVLSDREHTPLSQPTADTRNDSNSSSASYSPTPPATRKPTHIQTNPDDMKKSAMIQFNGLYQSTQTENYWSYLRFYDDGLVLQVSSTGNPEQVARWLIRDNKENYSSGEYRLVGRKISFTTTSREGSVDYDGTLHGNTMVLASHSHINEHRSTDEYVFCECENE